MVVWSGGPLTPRKYKPIFFVRCKICRSLPCPAAIARVWRPRRWVDDGQLKPSLEDNICIPLAGARRLKPCQRKATVSSGKRSNAYVAVYINYKIKYIQGG